MSRLADLAYTLQVGRDEMPERLAFEVANTTELREKIGEIVQGLTPAQSYRGNIKSGELKSKIPEGGDEQSFISSSDSAKRTVQSGRIVGGRRTH